MWRFWFCEPQFTDWCGRKPYVGESVDLNHKIRVCVRWEIGKLDIGGRVIFASLPATIWEFDNWEVLSLSFESVVMKTVVFKSLDCGAGTNEDAYG